MLPPLTLSCVITDRRQDRVRSRKVEVGPRGVCEGNAELNPTLALTLTTHRVGYWITYSSICKLVTLVGLLPLAARVLRKNAPLPARLRPKEEGEEQTAWDEEAAHLKLAGDSGKAPGYLRAER